ncbi:MAG TPA: hypothetical protein VK698_24370 [Kofleriaceae bacterium]|nr:hypothetical protein [Kofleriaceae bacterium]
MSGSVGADIEALCSKCGDVWHVVVAKVGAEIVKVQCKECGGYHRYRRAGALAAPTTRKPRTTGASRPSGTRASRLAAAAAAEAAFKPDMSAPIRPYTMSEMFRPGEQITHPRFGVGLVEQTSEPGKMAVVFADGRRILAQAKRESAIGTANSLGSLTPDREES